MNWKDLTSVDQLEQIRKQSSEVPQVIFKHSTRCSISAVAKSRLERSKQAENIDFYYLDLIRHRDISNQIESDFMVNHESPQILLIKNGACVYDESHNGISMDEIASQAKK